MPDAHRQRLWLDSSIVFTPGRLRELATLARTKGVALAVHPQVHLETCRRLRVKHGHSYSEETIRDYLEISGISVEPFAMDAPAAESWASALAERYPTQQKWKAAKLQALRARLPRQSRLRAHRVPMTTDWLIALPVESSAADVIAVEDQGEEWRALRQARPPRALRYIEAMRWLASLDDAPEQ